MRDTGSISLELIAYGVELTTHSNVGPRLKKIELYPYSPYDPAWPAIV
jgi:hypothetical protein